MKFLKKLFDHEYKELERFTKLADEVVALDEEYSKLSDEKLKAKSRVMFPTIQLLQLEDMTFP